MVDEKISNNEIVNVILKSSSIILKEIKLFDIYKGDKIDKDKKSLAYSLEYQSKEKTLKDSEIDKEVGIIVQSLEEKLNAIQR